MELKGEEKSLNGGILHAIFVKNTHYTLRTENHKALLYNMDCKPGFYEERGGGGVVLGGAFLL